MIPRREALKEKHELNGGWWGHEPEQVSRGEIESQLCRVGDGEFTHLRPPEQFR